MRSGIFGSGDRKGDGDVLLDEVGAARTILTDVIRDAQTVRVHRNNLVDRRTDDHAAAMAFADARGDLPTFIRG